MASEIYATLASSFPTIIIASSIFFLITLLPTINYKLKVAKLPIFGATSSSKGQYRHFYNSAFKIYSDGYYKVGKGASSKRPLN